LKPCKLRAGDELARYPNHPLQVSSPKELSKEAKEKSMRKMSAIGLYILFLLPTALMAQTTQFRFVQDGEFASFSQNNGSLSGVSFSVSRGITKGSPASASLSYSTFSITVDPTTGIPTSVSFSNQFGQIPPSAFTGQNTQNLALNIDTSTLDPTQFFNQSCTVDVFTGVETCAPGPLGVINLQFTENDFQRTTIHALQEDTTNGPITTRIHQRSDNSTANFQGTIYGAPYSGANGQVGVNHLSSIEMISNP